MTSNLSALKVPLYLIYIASLPSKAYDKFNEYIYKVSFALNKLSNFFSICLPNESDENKLTISNHYMER